MFQTVAIIVFLATLGGIIVHCFAFPASPKRGGGAKGSGRGIVGMFSSLLKPKDSLLGILKKLCYLAAAMCFLVLALTGFWPLLVRGEHISGYLMMIHATFAPVFAICLAIIALTWAGVALAVGALDAQVLQANARGSVYVLLCAATFATYFLVSERYTRRVGSLPFTVFAMTGAAAGLLAWYLPRHAAWPSVPDAASGWLLLLLVVFSTVAPVLMLAEGVRRVGAQRGAIVSTVGPPFTIVVAWLLLDEKLTAGQLFGTVLIVAGILAVERARRRAASA